MKTQTTTKYDEIIIDIIHKLPSDCVLQLINFAKFLLSQVNERNDNGKDESNSEINTTEDEWEELLDRLDLAISLKQSGQLEKAEIELKKLIKQEPLFIDAYNHLGNIEFDKKNYKKALKLYEKAFKTTDLYEIVKNENNTDSASDLISWLNVDCRPFFRAMHGLGLCYMETGNIEKAVEFLELILKYDPNDHQFVSFLLGDLHFKAGNYKQAIIKRQKNIIQIF
ncbi:MAG: tetratricopeptide repeat protein [Desulfobacterales bacterium]|nr:tetratricopeptide repeat protein [Desulfobacterales bacterium]